MEVVPTVEALPHNQFVGHKAVFINEPKLSDFKLVLLQEGISAEFIAGVLICNNNVAVRRVSIERRLFQAEKFSIMN